jgi:1-deoxyxylulose-5-phosphate synthase
MDYVNFGHTGLKVSRICLGCMTYGSPATGKLLPGRQAWALSEAESIPFFRQALDLGINFFDTANVYHQGAAEKVVGRALKDYSRASVVAYLRRIARSLLKRWGNRSKHSLFARKSAVFCYFRQ